MLNPSPFHLSPVYPHGHQETFSWKHLSHIILHNRSSSFSARDFFIVHTPHFELPYIATKQFMETEQCFFFVLESCPRKIWIEQRVIVDAINRVFIRYNCWWQTRFRWDMSAWVPQTRATMALAALWIGYNLMGRHSNGPVWHTLSKSLFKS